MSSCVNMNSQEFKDLVQQTGLNPLVLKSQIGVWADITGNNRIPTKEEIDYYHRSKETASDVASYVEDLHKEMDSSDRFNKEEYEKRTLEHALFMPVPRNYIYIDKDGNIHDIPGDGTTGDASKAEKKKNIGFVREWKERQNELIKKLEENKANYRRLNTRIKNTAEYKKKEADFENAITRLQNDKKRLTGEIGANIIFKSVIEELNFLEEELKNKDPFSTQNKEIFYRLNVLFKLVTGSDIKDVPLEKEDLAMVLDGEDIDGFAEIKNRVSNLKNDYKNYIRNVAQEAIVTNAVYANTLNKLSKEQVQDFFKRFDESLGKDINMMQGFFLGINENKDSNWVEAFQTIYETSLADVKKNVTEKERKIADLAITLRGKNFDFNKFIKKDKHGIEKDRLISFYTAEWGKTVNSISQLKFNVNTSHALKEEENYRKLIKEMLNNTTVIDIRKIKAIREAFGEDFKEHFKFSETEMNEYEAELRKEFGKVFDLEIENQISQIDKFLSRKENMELEKDPSIEVFDYKENPFKFIENYYSENRTGPTKSYEGFNVYNIGKYNRFIPRTQVIKTDKNGNNYLGDSGFMDANFNDIQNNQEAFDLWVLLDDILRNHINSAYSNISHLNSLPMFRKELSETLASAREVGGIFGWFKGLISYSINHMADLYYERGMKQDKDGIVSNYSNKASYETVAYKNALMLKTKGNLIKKAKESGLNMFNEDTPKEEIAEAIANKEVMENYSKDIIKNILAASNLATTQRARKDSVFILELLYDQHTKQGSSRGTSIKKARSWLDNTIYGKRNLINEDEDGNMITKGGKKRFTESEKRIEKVFNELAAEGSDDMEFMLDDVTYIKTKDEKTGEIKFFKNTFFKSDDSGESRRGPLPIKQKDFEEKLNDYIKQQADTRGISMTMSSLVQGIMKSLSLRFLGFNPKSGVKNRFDGWFMNLIADAEGAHWSTGNLKNATRILSFGNTFRLSSSGKFDFISRKRAQQLKTLDALMEGMGVLQDRRDVLDKKNRTSTFDRYKDVIDPHLFAVGMPEYKNQMEIAVSIMQDVKVYDAFGKEHRLCNGDGFVFDKDGKQIDDHNYFPMFKPGTLEVRDEFKYTREAFDSTGKLRTDVNLEDFINQENMAYENYSSSSSSNPMAALTIKVSKTISNIQGNYSNTDNLMIMDSIYGKVALMYKRYLPAHMNKRFGGLRMDMSTGETIEGRYRAMVRHLGAFGIFGSVIALSMFGPITALIIGGGTFLGNLIYKYIGNTFFGKKNSMGVTDNIMIAAGMLQEILVRSIDMPLKIPARIFKTKDFNEKFKNKALEKMSEKGVLKQHEVNAIRATAQELSMLITGQLAIMFLKNLFSGGDDDDKEKVGLRNYIDNLGTQIVGNLKQYYNPQKFMDDTSNIILLNYVNDVYKFVDACIKYNTEDYYTKEQMAEKLLRAQPILPLFNSPVKQVMKLVKGEPVFYDENEIVKNDWYDRYAISDEKWATKILENGRKHQKSLYMKELMIRLQKEYEYSRPEASKIAEEAAAKLMTNPDITKQTSDGETAIQANERVDFKKAKKEAKQVVNEFDIEGFMKKRDDKKAKKEKKAQDWIDNHLDDMMGLDTEEETVEEIE